MSGESVSDNPLTEPHDGSPGTVVPDNVHPSKLPEVRMGEVHSVKRVPTPVCSPNPPQNQTPFRHKHDDSPCHRPARAK